VTGRQPLGVNDNALSGWISWGTGPRALAAALERGKWDIREVGKRQYTAAVCKVRIPRFPWISSLARIFRLWGRDLISAARASVRVDFVV